MSELTPPAGDPQDEWAALRSAGFAPEEAPAEEAAPARHPRRNRGSHAAPPSRLRAIVKSLIAVAVFAAFIAVVLQWRGESGSDAGPGPVVLFPSPSSRPTPTAAATPTVATTPRSHSTPSPRPRPPHKPTPSAVAAVVPLTVLNNSTIHHLAARAAEDFHAKGWPIAAVGNFTGRISETTVYYDPGNAKQHAAARLLVSEFPKITRISERFEGLPGHGLTVVVTRYYA